jgi:hypothetical protein
MRLLNAVASIPVPGGGRLSAQPLPPPIPAPAANEAAKRRQSMMSTTTLDSSVSGRAPSDVSSSRLSVHFHAPHRRLSAIARAPATKPLYSEKQVSVGYRPAEHDEEDL